MDPEPKIETWKIRMRAFLTETELEEATNAPIADVIPEGLNLRTSTRTISYLLLAVENGPLVLIWYFKPAYEVWEFLRNLYKAGGFSSRYTLYRKLPASSNSLANHTQEIQLPSEDLFTVQIELPEDPNTTPWLMKNLGQIFDYRNIVGITTQDSQAYQIEAINLIKLLNGRKLRNFSAENFLIRIAFQIQNSKQNISEFPELLGIGQLEELTKKNFFEKLPALTESQLISLARMQSKDREGILPLPN